MITEILIHYNGVASTVGQGHHERGNCFQLYPGGGPQIGR